MLFHENLVTVSFRYFDYDQSLPEEIKRDIAMVIEESFLNKDDGDEILDVIVTRTGNHRLATEEEFSL